MIKERKDAKTTIVAGILLAGLFAGMLVAYKSELETTSWDAKSQSDKNTTNSTEENTALSLEKKEIDISGLKKQYKLIVLSIVLILLSYAKQVEKNVLRKESESGISVTIRMLRITIKSKIINRKYGKEPYEEK